MRKHNTWSSHYILSEGVIKIRIGLIKQQNLLLDEIYNIFVATPGKVMKSLKMSKPSLKYNLKMCRVPHRRHLCLDYYKN